MRLQKTVLIGMSMAAALGVTCMCRAEAADSAAAAGTVTIGIPVNISTLNAWDPDSEGFAHIRYTLDDALFYQTEIGGELISDMGKSYEVSNDGKMLTVELYDYIHDQAGNPITADDVVFSYNTYLETGNATGISRYIENIEAQDETHVVFTMPDDQTESLIAWQAILVGCDIYSQNAYDPETWATSPVATGPYKIESFTSGSELVLVKDEDYWQTEPSGDSPFKQQNVDKIIYKIIMESNQLSLAMQTGDIDVTEAVSVDDLPFFTDAEGEALDGYTVSVNTGILCLNLSFNGNAEGGSVVAGDVNLRKAIAYAMDRAAMCEAIKGNTAVPIHTQGNDRYPDYNGQWDELDYSYDADLAKEYLEKSDYAANGSPAIRILTTSQDDKVRLAQLIQMYLQDIGISAEVLNYDTALYDNYKYDFSQWDVKIDNQANFFNLLGMWSNFWTTTHTSYNGSPCNFWGLNDPDLDALVATASNKSTTSQEAVDACWEYATTDQCWVLGIWSPNQFAVAQSGIQDVLMNATLFPIPNGFTYADDYSGIAG